MASVQEVDFNAISAVFTGQWHDASDQVTNLVPPALGAPVVVIVTAPIHVSCSLPCKVRRRRRVGGGSGLPSMAAHSAHVDTWSRRLRKGFLVIH